MKMRLLFIVLLLLVVRAHAQLANPTEDSLQRIFSSKSKNMDPLEGIWSVSQTQETYHFDTLFNVHKPDSITRVAIVNTENTFKTINLFGEPLDVEFFSTDVRGVYLYRNYFIGTQQYSKKQAVICKAGLMEYTYDFPEEYLIKELGINYKEGTRRVCILRWTRTFPGNVK